MKFKLFLSFVAVTVIFLGCNPAKLALIPPDGTILAFGDSLTIGKGVDLSGSYPGILSDLTGRNVVNAGITGENNTLNTGSGIIQKITNIKIEGLSKEQMKEIKETIQDESKLDIGLSGFHEKLLQLEPMIWNNESDILKSILKNCVFIIVGTSEGAELFDRYLAYKIANELEKYEFYSIVLTDIYWNNIVEKHGYDKCSLITVGGPVSNCISSAVMESLNIEGKMIVAGVQEMSNAAIGYVWGKDARSTIDAVNVFIKSSTKSS